mmetsp:Transcript_32622/g.78401  ORF Transcript_32622/g.78401 Transcript_32622/m.78401 type:complete len:416 (-) Transcript_32622:1953-3200(-)
MQVICVVSRSSRPLLSHLLQFLIEFNQLIFHLVHFILSDISLSLGVILQFLLDLLDAVLNILSGGQCVGLDLMDITHSIREELLILASLLHLLIFVLTAFLAETSVTHDPLLLADPVTEFLIVGNYQHTTSPSLDGNCQSTQGITIQIVGRLVQHQNMRVLPHACTKHSLDLLASRERPDGSVSGELSRQSKIAQMRLNGRSAQHLAHQPSSSSLNLILTLALLLVSHGKQSGPRYPSARHVHPNPLHLILVRLTLFPLPSPLDHLQSDGVLLVLGVVLLLALGVVPNVTFLQLLIHQFALHDLLLSFLLGGSQVRHCVQRLIVLRTGKPLQHILYRGQIKVLFQMVEGVLGHVGNSCTTLLPDRARVWLEQTQQALDHRGLPTAIGTDDSNSAQLRHRHPHAVQLRSRSARVGE